MAVWVYIAVWHVHGGSPSRSTSNHIENWTVLAEENIKFGHTFWGHTKVCGVTFRYISDSYFMKQHETSLSIHRGPASATKIEAMKVRQNEMLLGPWPKNPCPPWKERIVTWRFNLGVPEKQPAWVWMEDVMCQLYPNFKCLGRKQGKTGRKMGISCLHGEAFCCQEEPLLQRSLMLGC